MLNYNNFKEIYGKLNINEDIYNKLILMINNLNNNINNDNSIYILNILKSNYNYIYVLIYYINNNNNNVNELLEKYILYLYNLLLKNNSITKVSGKVYIASMNMRGKWAEPIDNSAIKINVTSSQVKESKNRLAFSPMTEIVGGYKGYWCFENYWQSGKVFEGVTMETTKKWWKALKEAKRRYPGSKDKKVLYATWDDGKTKLDYIESRKKVYVPEYYNLIKNREMLKYWRNELQKGKNLIIYDFDGPRDNNGNPISLELSKELLINKINDVKFPFGHGYIVAASISNILPSEYI